MESTSIFVLLVVLIQYYVHTAFAGVCANTPSIPNAEPYNKALAKTLARYSAIAYLRSTATLEAWTCKKCRSDGAAVLQSVDRQRAGSVDASVFSGYDPHLDAIVVSFRGSKTMQNWLLNFKFALSRSSFFGRSGGKLHAGFLESYASLRSMITDRLQTLFNEYSTRRIYVTGHSMGGALATIAAPDFKNTFKSLDITVVVYTFASPRVGDKDFVRYFINRVQTSYRGYNTYDSIPSLPPCSFGYAHVPKSKKINKCNFERFDTVDRHQCFFNYRPMKSR